jgi:hypothetical protein
VEDATTDGMRVVRAEKFLMPHTLRDIRMQLLSRRTHRGVVFLARWLLRYSLRWNFVREGRSSNIVFRMTERGMNQRVKTQTHSQLDSCLEQMQIKALGRALLLQPLQATRSSGLQTFSHPYLFIGHSNVPHKPNNFQRLSPHRSLLRTPRRSPEALS